MRTCWSVAIAETESAVRKVIDVDSVMMNRVGSSPTLPMTHPRRRYMITPRMVRMEGVNTPANVPSPRPRGLIAGPASADRRPKLKRMLGITRSSPWAPARGPRADDC